jgi:protease-4
MKKHPILSALLITAVVVAFFVGLTVLAFNLASKGLLVGEKVGVLEVKGILLESQPFLKQLDKFQKDSRIKAIVVRVNSPGGAVGPSQEIMRELEKVRKEKKIVASMSTLAASGGYYVCLGADLIMASPGTATGSIGVIAKFSNVEQLTKKLGLDFFSLKAGRYKDAGTPFRRMTPEERAYMQRLLDNIYEQFIQDVARARNLPLAKVRTLAEGQVYTGAQAKDLGLVDELGNLSDAIERAGRLAGIVGKVEAVYPEKERSLLRLLLGSDQEESLSRALSLPYPEPAFLPPWFQ